MFVNDTRCWLNDDMRGVVVVLPCCGALSQTCQREAKASPKHPQRRFNDHEERAGGARGTDLVPTTPHGRHIVPCRALARDWCLYAAVVSQRVADIPWGIVGEQMSTLGQLD